MSNPVAIEPGWLVGTFASHINTFSKTDATSQFRRPAPGGKYPAPQINTVNLQLKVTMTFGLVEYDTKLRLDENINIADERLYIGKEEGRDRIIY